MENHELIRAWIRSGLKDKELEAEIKARGITFTGLKIDEL